MTYKAIAPGTVLYKLFSDERQPALYFGVSGPQKLPDHDVDRLEAEFVREDHPGIEERRLELDRRWDMLHYLLSEKRRQNLPSDRKDLMYRAIYGGAELGDGFVMIQGVPVTYLTPQEVSEISAALNQISPESLSEHWNPPLMREAGVYKIRGDEDESRLEYLLDDFDRLRDFYLLTAAFDEGVLVFCD